MKNRILLIGTLSNKERNYITGQSVIFDSIVDYFSERHDVSVINTNDSGRYDRGSNAFFVARIIQFFFIYLKLLWILSTKRNDVVYYQTAMSAFGLKRDLIALKIISLFEVPVVAHQFGNYNIEKLFAGDDNSIRRLFRLSKKLCYIIVEGQSMVGEYQKYGISENKIVVIPNGFKETNTISKSPKSYNNDESFKLLYLSNLIFSKGYFDVLRAIDILVNQEDLNVVCCFAGKFYRAFEGIDNDDDLGTKDAFEDYIKEHELEDRIKYFSGLFGEEKAEAFLESNVFVLPTYYSGEGQPMSILEAMSYGCVPIVTNNGHIPMMVNDSNGCLVEQKNPEDIAKHIRYLINNPNEYTEKSLQCINDYQSKFRFELFANNVLKCLLSVIKK